MNAQLNYIAAQQHAAELHRAAARARPAGQAPKSLRSARKPGPITRLGARLTPHRA